MSAHIRKILAIVVTIAVVAVVIGGLYLAGSPEKAREKRIDQHRVADLRSISQAVDLYWSREGHLPNTLADAAKELKIYHMNGKDPETNTPYDYRVINEKKYELCARFSASSPDTGYYVYGKFWVHDTGRYCYQLEPKTATRN